MKSFIIENEWHERLKKISEKTGIRIYRLIYEAIEWLESKYGK